MSVTIDGWHTSEFGHVGHIIPQEEVVSLLVPLHVVLTHHAEVTGEAEQAWAASVL